jgi:hypothetical protein
MIERLQSRTNNCYGKSPEEEREVLSNLREVEPLLREVADAEIDTQIPLDEVVDEILEFVGVEG